jgi:hypothetical protein
MRLELERDLELFFFLKIEGNYLSSSFVCCSFTSDTQRTFVALQFACSMTNDTKIAQFD